MTPMQTDQDTFDSPEAAEAWLARLLAEDCSAEDKAAHAQWRDADPEHAGAFAETERLHDMAALLKDDPMIRAATRAAKRNAAPRRYRPMGWIAAAAVLVCAIGIGLFRFATPPAAVHYASSTALQTITLADGTRLQLDASSAATVQFDRSRRIVLLDRGRAEFDVADDPGRPFEVRAGDTVIRDIGTTFQVSRNDQGIRVGLLEGAVEITGSHAGTTWTQALKPAEQLDIDADGIAGKVAPLDLSVARAWPQGQLVFQERRLDDVLAEANRYSSTKLRVTDPALAALRISGNIHAGDQQTLLKSLEQGWQLQAERTADDEFHLRRGPTKPAH